jgi:abortive infection bacteriophage resistance protein
MEFTKAALTFEEQADLLVMRGLTGRRGDILTHLQNVNYYRLSGYWYHKLLPDDHFQPGLSIGDVWNLYVFDRKLRLLLIDAIERIEVGIRTRFSYFHALAHGPFAYMEHPDSLPSLDNFRRCEIQSRIVSETERQSREHFVANFKSKYGDRHRYLPVWMATELMSFGSVLGLLKGSNMHVSRQVSSVFHVSPVVLLSWLWSLNEVRNVCAHHGRLWNRPLGNKPLIPREAHHPEWHTPVIVGNQRIFVVLTICASLLASLAPDSRWKLRLRELLADYPDIPTQQMGFPDNWVHCPIWSLAPIR